MSDSLPSDGAFPGERSDLRVREEGEGLFGSDLRPVAQRHAHLGDRFLGDARPEARRATRHVLVRRGVPLRRGAEAKRLLAL